MWHHLAEKCLGMEIKFYSLRTSPWHISFRTDTSRQIPKTDVECLNDLHFLAVYKGAKRVRVRIK